MYNRAYVFSSDAVETLGAQHILITLAHSSASLKWSFAMMTHLATMLNCLQGLWGRIAASVTSIRVTAPGLDIVA